MGNPLKGILGSARKMGLDPMAMVANAVGQGNPMLGQLMKFATQYKGKSPNELKNLVVMVYSDYYGYIPNDLTSYVNIAKAFIEDKDAAPGKSYRYYVAMKDPK